MANQLSFNHIELYKDDQIEIFKSTNGNLRIYLTLSDGQLYHISEEDYADGVKALQIMASGPNLMSNLRIEPQASNVFLFVLPQRRPQPQEPQHDG